MFKVKYVKMAIIAVVFCAALSSCNVSDEATKTTSELQTQVVLSQKNFRVVREVYGESKQHYVLCIGGMSKKSMRSCAVEEMMKNANLTGSEAIINVHVQYKTAGALGMGRFGLWGLHKAIARGTVIEFTE